MKRQTPLLLFATVSACASTHAISPSIAGASVDFAGAQTVEVTLSDFEFTPSSIRLEAGRPYVLKLTNIGSGGHDFTAPEFFAAASFAPEDAKLVRSGQVEMPANQSTTVQLVPGAGEFNLVCTHTGHVLLGMKGKIIVD